MSANILKDEILTIQNKQKVITYQIEKYSWIEDIELKFSLSDEQDKDYLETNKKISLGIDQDIFKGGEFYYLNQKNNLEKSLNEKEFIKKINQKNIKISKIVLEIKKIDLELEQLNYLLSNILYEINEEKTYELQIEKYELQNTIIDLNTNKNNLLSDLKKVSSKKYKDIFVSQIELVKIEEQNAAVNIQDINKINLELSQLDKKIQKTEFLPKLSVYADIGYRFDRYKSTKYDYDDKEQSKFYEYGIYLSIPFGLNHSKKNKLASLKYIEKIKIQKLKKEEKKEDFLKIKKEIYSINKKIDNYKKIYALKVKSYEKNGSKHPQIITNNLNYEKIHIDILNIEKQLLFYGFIDL